MTIDNPPPIAPGNSESLSDVAAVDESHLQKYGYKQELNRALGLFSSFGVQFTSISVGSVLFTTLIVGFGFFGPASFWPFVIGGALQVFGVGLAVAQLVSAFPLSGGVYQIISRLAPKQQWLAWQGGWWLVIAHTVAVAALAVSMVPFIADWFGIDDLSNTQITLYAIGIIVLVTLVNIAGVKAAALLNNIGVVAEAAIIVMVIVALVVAKYPQAPSSVLFDTGGAVGAGGNPAWMGFLFAMILPAYAISSFDATGNAAEETRTRRVTPPGEPCWPTLQR
jgi:amino acid transporter